MQKLLSQVTEFHNANGVPVVKRPRLPAMSRRMLRLSLLAEEYQEYAYAERDNDLVEIADALGDMAYIIAGTALEYGIPLDRVLDEIHRANMSKLGVDGKPVVREDGKIIKGPNYQPPDIVGAMGLPLLGSMI